VSEVDPSARLRWLEKLASDFSGGHAIHLTLTWENDHGVAGVLSYPNETFVYLHNAQQSVESLSEAAQLLRAIFADQLVAVTAFAGDQVVYSGLAPASDPSGGFNQLDKPLVRDMPEIDFVTIENWSSGLQEPD
jgi:hypothetical protein